MKDKSFELYAEKMQEYIRGNEGLIEKSIQAVLDCQYIIYKIKSIAANLPKI